MRDGERPGAAGGGGKAVPRERTLLGTGTSGYGSESPRGAPSGVPVAARERTVLGIAPPSGLPGAAAVRALAGRAPAREFSQQEPPPEGWDLPQPAPFDPSILVDLSELASRARRSPAAANPRVPSVELADEPSLVPAGVPRRGRSGWRVLWAALLLVVAGAIAFSYVRRDVVEPLAREWALRLVETRPVAALRALVAPHPRAPSDAPH